MPEPKSPVIPGLENREIIIAKDQPEYLPLPALIKQEDGQSVILCRWQLNEVDRDRIAAGADVFVETMLINNHILTPTRVRVLHPDTVRDQMEKEGY